MKKKVILEVAGWMPVLVFKKLRLRLKYFKGSGLGTSSIKRIK